MRNVFPKLAVIAAFAVAAPASAQIVPEGTFGPQPSITWGGSGIPNDAVMVNDGASSALTLALSASQRCGSIGCNPALTNDGLGTFFASPGADFNPPSPADAYAKWNFNWAVSGTAVGQYTYALYYDFFPAVGNSQLTHFLAPSPLLFADGFQNSWNLGMNILDQTGPFTPNFDPNAEGEYTFKLAAYSGLREVTSTSIRVNVSTVPEPSSYALMAAGLAGIGFVARRRKHNV